MTLKRKIISWSSFGLLILLFSGCIPFGHAARYRLSPELENDPHPKMDMMYAPEFLLLDRPLEDSQKLILKRAELFQAMGQMWLIPFLIRYTHGWYGFVLTLENLSKEPMQVEITHLKLWDKKRKWSALIVHPDHPVKETISSGNAKEIFSYDSDYDFGVRHDGWFYKPSARLKAFEAQVKIPSFKGKLEMEFQYTVTFHNQTQSYSEKFLLEKENYLGFWPVLD